MLLMFYSQMNIWNLHFYILLTFVSTQNFSGDAQCGEYTAHQHTPCCLCYVCDMTSCYLYECLLHNYSDLKHMLNI